MVANIKTNIERLSFPLLVIFTTLASILAIGDFNRFLAIQDTSTSGIFNTNLLLYPELYQDDVIRHLAPLGYLNPLVLVQYILKVSFNIDPFYSSYFFLVFANIVFVLGSFSLSKFFLNKNSLSAVATLISLALVIQNNNLALFGSGTSFQVFPDMNFYALGIICLFFTTILNNKLFHSIIYFQLLVFVHLGHAILILPIFYIYLIINLTFFRENKFYLIRIFTLSLIPLSSIFLFTSLNFINVNETVSNDHILSFLVGTIGGHIYPWENQEYFSVLFNYFAIFTVFILSINKDLTKNFWILFASLISMITFYVFLHIFILLNEISPLIKFVQLLPMRSSVYIQLLIFPIILVCFFRFLQANKIENIKKIFLVSILIFMGSHKSFASWVFFDANYFNFGNFILIKILFSISLLSIFYLISKKPSIKVKNLSISFLAILFSGFITLESFNFFYGSVYANEKDREFVTLLKWMNEKTPPESRFITIDYHIQVNGISNRSTFRPFPFIPEVYRSQNAKAEIFSNEILDYWKISKKKTHGWFDLYDKQNIYNKFYNLNKNEIIDLKNKSNSNYFITNNMQNKLDLPTAYIDNTHIIYKLD